MRELNFLIATMPWNASKNDKYLKKTDAQAQANRIRVTASNAQLSNMATSISVCSRKDRGDGNAAGRQDL